MELLIKKAERQQRKARILLAGPSGAGKTMTALRLAEGLRGNGRILLLDTERGSATLYADNVDFDHADLPNYEFDTYLAALKQAAAAGYAVVVVDSASHAWESLLEEHGKMQGNSFANWRKITPKYDQLVQAILNYPGHIIVTVRAKMKYEQDDKKQVKPIGLDPVMRDGFEYEFDMYGMIDIEHHMAIRKTRIERFADKIITRPGEELGKEIRDWLASGKPEPIIEPADLPDEYVIETDCGMKGKSLALIREEFPEWLGKALIDPKRKAALTKRDQVNIKAYMEANP